MKNIFEEHLAAGFARAISHWPVLTLSVIAAVVAGSVYLGKQLTVNTDQLQLLDPNLRAVQDVQEVIEMVGGAGHLFIALRGSDEKLLKEVTEDVAKILEDDPEHIRHFFYKVRTDFVRERAGLFMKTEDLEVVRDRVFAYLEDQKRRADPFFFELRPTEPVKLELEDIIAKYRKIGRKTITDDYWISDDKQMLTIVAKPNWAQNELGKTGELVDLLRQRFTEYGKTGKATLVEDYEREPSSDPKIIEYAFSGGYKLAYDESYEIKKSLVPVSAIAFAGVFAVMLLFFRSRFAAVILVVTGLIAGVAVSFGFARLAVGELNMVTSMLAGILMGLGIDFGIHVVYRLREELEHGVRIREAVRIAIIHQGPASFVSAAGIGAAFFSLLFSDFQGFSQFGLLAGAGVILIGLVIYAWIPAVLTVLEDRKKGLAVKALGSPRAQPEDAQADRIPRPWLLLGLSSTFALLLTALAPGVVFDYDTRTLSVENQPSRVLLQEINDRFGVSYDPLAIVTPDLKATEAVYRALSDNPDRYPMVDSVLSVFTFVPPHDQQVANAKILQEAKARLQEIDPAVLPPKVQERWDEGMRFLDAKPYTVEDLPDFVANQFQGVGEAKAKGRWLSFAYPAVDLWSGKRVMALADQVEEIHTAEGETFHSAGLPILYAYLARVVLHDANVAVAITAIALFLILLLDLRSISSALIALLPLVLGMGMMLGAMRLLGMTLNFMNIVVFPIVLGYGVSHGVYLMHRFDEGATARQALRSVGTAVLASTLTTLAGWAALLFASHRGLRTVGSLACLGMLSTLVVSFTVMPAVLQLLDDRRRKAGKVEVPESPPPFEEDETPPEEKNDADA
ncbi:MAG: MMPL family transporter [Deltaproteobacteria bacterium]|nr:MMPL family transporter [Deltaproteobacteria bacterium]